MWLCVYTHLILHHGPLLCRPAVVGVMWHCGGAAKVTQLDGALVTNQEVLNLHKGSVGFTPQSHLWTIMAWHTITDLKVSVDDRRLLFVHVLDGPARLVEDFQHRVTWQGSLLLYPFYEVHQLTWHGTDTCESSRCHLCFIWILQPRYIV